MVRENISKLTPYASARDEAEALSGICLDANENPFSNGVNRYPDPHQKALRKELAAIKNVKMEQIILGNGSDEIIDMIFRCYCRPGIDEIIITPPTYGMYKVLAKINDIGCREVLLQPDFSLNVDAILGAVTSNTKIIVLCSPNNPSGNLLSDKDIESILSGFKGWVLLDEAYIDFVPEASWVDRLALYPQLIICQTLSKAWGMAGLRVGMAIADAAVINILKKIKPPYNINQLTQDKALELLQDKSGFKERVEYLQKETARLQTELKKLDLVLKVYQADANFLLVKFQDPNIIYQRLAEQSIIVRNRSSEPLCEGCLRISVGLEEENNVLIDCLKSISL